MVDTKIARARWWVVSILYHVLGLTIAVLLALTDGGLEDDQAVIISTDLCGFVEEVGWVAYREAGEIDPTLEPQIDEPKPTFRRAGSKNDGFACCQGSPGLCEKWVVTVTEVNGFWLVTADGEVVCTTTDETYAWKVAASYQ